jgi:alpha-L-arabinofuranosidase
LFASAVKDEAANEVIVKVINPQPSAQGCTLDLAGLPKEFTKARVTVLAGSSGADENSFENPLKVAPRTQTREITSRFQHTFPPLSATVLRVGGK